MRGRNGSNALLRIYFCVFYGYDCTYSGLAHEAIFHTPIYHFYPYGCDGGVMWIGIHHYYGDFLHRMNSEWVYDKSLYFLLLSIPLSALGKFGWIFIILFYAFCFKQIPLKAYRQYAPLLYIVGLELCIIIAIFMSISQTITTRYFMELYPLIYLFLASILVYASRYAVFYIPALTLILVAHITYHSATYHKEDLRAASASIATHFDSQNCKLPLA